LEGYLYIILGGEEYDTIAQKIQGSFILKMSSWVIVFGLLCAVTIGLVIFALLTGRLKKLAAGMNAFKSGESLASVDLPREKTPVFLGDEVDHLSHTFREMAERIEEQIEKLQKSDLLRRELVANVSHDLRTPLATLTAYIETMLLKESVLSGDERRKYLKVAGKHCERLSSLVDDLFELASLDAEETKLNLEPFNIAELVQDIVQNFELAAKENGITLTSNIGENLSSVNADIALVERVLENLIMNALRHTPKGGTVSIILSPSDEYMKVQVLDTGVGIPEEALPHIFDRFYKINGADNFPTSFAGLGLAIAKRIMDLHGSDVEVESELNSGTCFTFMLPVSISS
jgi:signal transduction histidine kinase